MHPERVEENVCVLRCADGSTKLEPGPLTKSKLCRAAGRPRPPSPKIIGEQCGNGPAGYE